MQLLENPTSGKAKALIGQLMLLDLPAHIVYVVFPHIYCVS